MKNTRSSQVKTVLKFSTACSDSRIGERLCSILLKPHSTFTQSSHCRSEIIDSFIALSSVNAIGNPIRWNNQAVGDRSLESRMTVNRKPYSQFCLPRTLLFPALTLSCHLTDPEANIISSLALIHLTHLTEHDLLGRFPVTKLYVFKLNANEKYIVLLRFSPLRE